MRRFAFLPAALVLVAACATSQPGTPALSAPPSPVATPNPTASASTAPTPTPSPTAIPSPAVTPVPTGSPSSSMTAAEKGLVALLRPDAAIDCMPRRTNLPEGAVRGIECRADDPLVASVGLYWYPTGNEAAHAYMTRLAAYGVDVNAGDCSHDVPGDAPWTPGDDVGNYDDPGVFNWENSVLSPDRNGCFRNENGLANVRATCGNAYIGVLGTKKDLSELYDWARRYPAGSPHDTPEPPGICVSGR